MDPPAMEDGPSRFKNLKVAIPFEHHLNLVRLRLLTGERMSTVVTRALDAYFAQLEALRSKPALGETTADGEGVLAGDDAGAVL